MPKVRCCDEPNISDLLVLQADSFWCDFFWLPRLLNLSESLKLKTHWLCQEGEIPSSDNLKRMESDNNSLGGATFDYQHSIYSWWYLWG